MHTVIISQRHGSEFKSTERREKRGVGEGVGGRVGGFLNSCSQETQIKESKPVIAINPEVKM